MITIVFANRKGGVGKSTLSVHFAWFVAHVMKKRVLFIDLDDQANSSSTLAQHATGVRSTALFQEAPLPAITATDSIALIEAEPAIKRYFEGDLTVAGEFVSKVEGLAPDFDFCVVDTSPAWNRTHEAAMLSAGYFATPVNVESYAIQGLDEFLNNTRRLITFKQRNGGDPLTFLGIIVNLVSNTSPAHKEKVAQLRDVYGDLVLKQTLGLRTSIGEAIDEGVPVWKVQKSAAREAAKEMQLLFTQLLQRVASIESAKGGK